MKIKVVSQNAWEVVGSAAEALDTAKVFEQNGYGHANFYIQDDDGAWIEVDASELE